MVGYWLLTDKLPVFVDKACVSLLLWKRECPDYQSEYGSCSCPPSRSLISGS